MTTKWFLANAMFNRELVVLYSSSGTRHEGIINNLGCEDGSTHSWLVTLHNGQHFHVRTSD